MMVIEWRTAQKLGYEVVKTQQAVVASLKSPVRIQQIAEQQLGMVLPDSFVYRHKKRCY